MIIAQGNLNQEQLTGKVAIVTGAGGGIGFETARALIWLGAKVILAEVDKDKGKKAQAQLGQEFGPGWGCLCQTDVAQEMSIQRLHSFTGKHFGQVDIIINNATVTPVGAIHEVGIPSWDKSFAVNLRGPVLLTRYFLPQMLARDDGVMVFVSSSGAAPFLGAYEVFKGAQVELGNTLAAELENTGVVSFVIGPGMVKTATAQQAITQLAPLYGLTEDEFYRLNSDKMLTVEEAGAGFAAAVALAEKYRGTEIGAMQALMAAGITIASAEETQIILTPARQETILTTLRQVKETFSHQVEGWRQRNIFERQWVLRDFKKQTGSSPEVFVELLAALEKKVAANTLSSGDLNELPTEKLALYYRHLLDLMQGYEKDPAKVVEQTEIITGWIEEIREFARLLKGDQ